MIRTQAVISLVFALLLIATPLVAHAQLLWSGILDPSRAIDWSRTNPGVEGGIPNRTFICATLNPGTTSAQINNAIASCSGNAAALAAGGGVVFLNAGTYTLAAGVDFSGHSNVTLRGAGPDQTILIFTGAASCSGLGADVCVWDGVGSNPGGNLPNTATCTAGCIPGSTVVTLSNTTRLFVGGMLVLDQANDGADNGGIWVNDTTCCTEGGSPGRSVNGVHYNQHQHVRVTAINGNVVTITPGLYMPTWRASQNPGAWWPGSHIEKAGIEAMTLNHTNTGGPSICSGGVPCSGIIFLAAHNSWVKNVKSLSPNRNHIWLHSGVSHIEIRDSYFYGTRNAATVSYGIEPFYTTDNLVINNIFQHMPNAIVAGAMVGTVFAYNYAFDHFYSNPSGFMQAEYMAHDAMAAFNLYEGNDSNGIFTDAIHGTNALGTMFRNRLSGWEPGKTGQTNAGINDAYNRAYNWVGNIMGTVGYHTIYQANSDQAIWIIGFKGGAAGSFDPIANSSLLRWGNYDTVNATVRWLTSEIPIASIPFVNGNPLPANHNLPASFFLSSRPAFWVTPWGTPAWPPIGPDVTGGSSVVGPGGFAYKIPARLCYENSPKDVNGILTFNAGNCYSQQSGTAPAPPLGLIVQ